MGPVEWGTVVAHWPYGLDVFLDSSGEVGTVGITSINNLMQTLHNPDQGSGGT